jgi:membrane-bound ClpP family serine protease
MKSGTVNTLGGILILVGFIFWAVTGSVGWLLCALCGAGLIIEDWINPSGRR